MQKIEQWFFKHYSQATFEQHQLVRNLTALILAFPAVIGVILDATGRPLGATIAFIFFMAFVVIWAIIWIVVWVYHNWRIKNEKKSN